MKRAIYIRALTALSISVGAFVAGGGALVSGCSSPDTSATVDPIGPDRAQFDFVAPVASVMVTVTPDFAAATSRCA